MTGKANRVQQGNNAKGGIYMYRDSLDYAQDRFSNVLESCTVLTPAEVMEVLRIGKNSVYTLLNSGKLRGFRIGRSWRISAEALEEFIVK